VVEIVGFTLSEPYGATAPIEERKAETALVELQDKVELCPGEITIGLALKVHDGA